MPPASSKVALVTGAARGIGLATAKRLLAEGWLVALLDIEGELLKGAVAAIANPDNALALHCDVSDARGVHAPADTNRSPPFVLVTRSGLSLALLNGAIDVCVLRLRTLGILAVNALQEVVELAGLKLGLHSNVTAAPLDRYIPNLEMVWMLNCSSQPVLGDDAPPPAQVRLRLISTTKFFRNCL